MLRSLRLLAFALAFALAARSPTASAQVKSPAMIEEDLPAEEAPAVEHPEPAPPPVPEAPPPRAAAPEAPVLVRAIEPVKATLPELLRAWSERRTALREQDLARATAAERRVIELKKELDIESLDALATEEARASRRARESRNPQEAALRAELAVTLAPDLVLPRLVLAEARLGAGDPWTAARPVLRDLTGAARAAWREPHTRRALLGDLAVALLAAVVAAGAAVIALLTLRHLKLVLHDARHLPVLRLATPLQAGALALALLALPVMLRLGPGASLAVLALAAALYLGWRERLVMAVALVAIAAVPWGAERAAELTAFTGTLADDVYTLSQGADDGTVAARLEARAQRGELPPPALVALGLHKKRRGDLAAALHWYEAAGASRPDVLVNTGNARLLLGEVDAAKAAYLLAVDRAGAAGDHRALAAAHYGLSKLFLRASALDQAQEARRKAAVEDAPLVERWGSDDDFRANRWLIDLPVTTAEAATLAGTATPTPGQVGEAIRARLSGPLPTSAGPGLLVGAAGVVLLAGLFRRRIGPAAACERCGNPACTRCAPAAGPLCAQCVNVYTRHASVEPRDRMRKHAQVHRRARARRVFARALGVVTGGAGHLWCGAPVRGALALLALAFLAALAVFWRGAVPPPQPTGWEEGAKLVLSVPAAFLVWAMAVRDLFHRTRGP